MRAALALGFAVLTIAGVAFLWACWRNRAGLHQEVRLDRWHHLYLGLALGGVGAWLRSPALLLLGAAVAGDDAWQHVRQVTGSPEYHSPLRVLFGHYLWPLEPVRWLTHWLDNVFS